MRRSLHLLLWAPSDHCPPQVTQDWPPPRWGQLPGTASSACTSGSRKGPWPRSWGPGRRRAEAGRGPGERARLTRSCFLLGGRAQLPPHLRGGCPASVPSQGRPAPRRARRGRGGGSGGRQRPQALRPGHRHPPAPLHKAFRSTDTVGGCAARTPSPHPQPRFDGAALGCDTS